MKKKLLIGLASLVGLGIIIGIIVLTNGPTPPEPGTLMVHFIDVGQGDSIFLDCDDIEVLIDGGGKFPGVVSYIDDYVDGSLEVMVATHPHADHIGGLIAVLDAFEVDEIWLNGDTSTSQTYSQFISAVNSEGAEVLVARRGDTIQASNLTFNVLHPVNLSGTINNNSIVLSLSYDQVDFLFTGDAEEEAEASILVQSIVPVPDVEILKVGHHGSRTASSTGFVLVTKPDCAIYMAGEGNSYGHPHEETIDNLCEVDAEIYGTDIHGTIVITTDGETYNVLPSNNMPPVDCPINTTHDLTISVNGQGTTNPSVGTYNYDSGTQVNITASPASGWEFDHWTGDVSSIADVNATQTSINMDGNYSITANFAQDQLIRNWYDLDAIRDNIGASYRLMNDLDSTTAGYMELASETANAGRGWEPIGTSDDQFTGSFNGQGYEIRDLFINRPGEHYVGLFAHISWMHPIENVGVIENVGLVNADVTGGRWVGALVGYNAGIVSNSYSTCSVTSEGWYLGGLVGYNDGGFVSDSYSTGNVTGNRYVGGLVGHITGARTVREGTVRNCYSTSSVTGFTRVGGLAGSILADVNMSNSYFAGSVTGRRWVGGLVAENYGGTVSNSYSTGSVTGDGYVGGLVGLNLWGTISSCYSTGTVSGGGPVGGLVGYNERGSVSNSSWDIITGGIVISAGGTGKTTAEMKSITTFTGAAWDIIAVAPGVTDLAYTWNIVDGETYPFLSWQSIS